ncbi:hypothetical protein GCM10007425_19100 [Lysinibacillus alkalisoli]|uniref:Uncharacterized protein n=1 Tax=Lysinibacillus alkalisoli TaxID=1911548 RepID=A0A917LHQ6_9BACI|nr:hypothetical protein [Lysinibacillus alkalisoli]GGG24699.1 hypothetical protein GCM10007425_19100 [Lysinibacillus alkalisoli]
MNALTILMPFLYFPEDKSEYIPAAISFTIFMIILFFVFRWVLKISRKQAAEAKKIEERVLKDKDINHMS